MIDIHSHIIPNMDDGSNSVEETFNMLHTGMEVYVSDQIKELLLNSKILGLANSRYILIEFPMSTQVKNLEKIIYILNSFNLIPVIAHPERYKYVQKDISIVEEYIELGCLIQCNYGSILDLYGKEAKKTLKILLKNNLVHFLGSDCHKQDTVYKYIPKAIKKIKAITGDKKFFIISTKNPQKILKDEDFED